MSIGNPDFNPKLEKKETPSEEQEKTGKGMLETRETETIKWLAEQLKYYEEIFDVSPDDLRNKKILEIGSFDRRFAASLVLSGIPVEAYSLEPALSEKPKESYAPKEMLMAVLDELPKEVRDEVEKRTIVSEAEAIPSEDGAYDLVIGKSVPYYSHEQLVKRITELLRVGKEVHLYPISSNNRADYESAIQSIKSIPVTVKYKTTTEDDVPMERGIVHVKEDVLILRK